MSGYVYGLPRTGRLAKPHDRRWPKVAGALAAGAGHALRVVRALGVRVPGVAGAVLVAVGLGLAWLPLGVVAAGAFLLLIDRRVPTA